MDGFEMILVIEAEAKLRTLLEVNLQARGYPAVAVPSPMQGCEKIQLEVPRMIILDISFDDNGAWTFLEKVAAYHAGVPVIVMTTNSQYHDTALQYPNVRQVLLKPFGIESILSLAAEVTQGI
jgi:DNA-binding NtrC family response regulator